jgi:hypothetical protein
LSAVLALAGAGTIKGAWAWVDGGLGGMEGMGGTGGTCGMGGTAGMGRIVEGTL